MLPGLGQGDPTAVGPDHAGIDIPARGGDLAADLRVPELDLAAGSKLVGGEIHDRALRDEAAAIGAVRDFERRLCVAAESTDQLAGRRVPDPHESCQGRPRRTARRRGGMRSSSGRGRGREMETWLVAAVVRVPDLHSATLIGRQDASAAMAEGHVINRLGVPLERASNSPVVELHSFTVLSRPHAQIPRRPPCHRG